MTTYHSPVRDPRGLKLHGPRLKVTIGPPLLRPSGGQRSPSLSSRFTETDALIDTGAQRTVISPEALRKAGLSKINEADVRGVGGIVRAGVYVASLQFPRCGLRTIEVIEVSCCELRTSSTIACLDVTFSHAGSSLTMGLLAHGLSKSGAVHPGLSHPKAWTPETPISGANRNASPPPPLINDNLAERQLYPLGHMP